MAPNTTDIIQTFVTAVFSSNVPRDVNATILHTYERDTYDEFLTRAVGLAAFTILIYDHIMTFSDEVEFIWKGSKGRLVYLFLLNRYLTPLGFIVNLIAYFNTSWSRETCSRFVRYEGTMTMIGIAIVDIMMFFRIQAFYNRHRHRYWIFALVLTIFSAWIGTNTWLLTNGIPVHHSDSNVTSCSMVFNESGAVAASSAWMPLLYDTVIVSLTAWALMKPLMRNTASDIMKVLLEEGLIYYSVIFSVTLALTIMISRSTQEVKNLMAQFELLITVTMMSRITLDLKRFGHYNSNAGDYARSITAPITRDPPGLTRHPHCSPPHSPPRRDFTDDPSYYGAGDDRIRLNNKPSKLRLQPPPKVHHTQPRSRAGKRSRSQRSGDADYGFGEVSASSWRSVGGSGRTRGLGVFEGFMPHWLRGPGHITHIDSGMVETGTDDSFFSRVTLPGQSGEGSVGDATRTMETLATRGAEGTTDEGVEVFQEVEVIADGYPGLGSDKDEEMGLGVSLTRSAELREEEEREERERMRLFKEAESSRRKGSGESGQSSGSAAGRGRHDPPVEMIEMQSRKPVAAGRHKKSKYGEPPPGFRGIGFDREGL